MTVQMAYYPVLEVNNYLIRYFNTAAVNRNVDCGVERIVRLDEKQAGMEKGDRRGDNCTRFA
jgi:hypothetical protein